MTEPTFPTIPGQRGLATHAQLLAAGWTTEQIRHRRSTTWQTPYPRVLAPHRGPLDAPTVVTAAALWAGNKAVLTGLVALREFGLTTPRIGKALFLVPETSRARVFGDLRLVRTTRPVVVRKKDGIVRFTGAARAVAEAAAHEKVRGEDLESLTIAALQRGCAAPDELELELWKRPQAEVEAARRGLDAFRGGAWSRPEAALRHLWDAHPELPELMTNVRLEHAHTGRFLGCPDGWLPGFATAIQVHSRQFHQGVDDRGGDRWADTVEKDSTMVSVGVRVLGVTPWTLYRRPGTFLERIQSLVELGPPTPMPDVRLVAHHR